MLNSGQVVLFLGSSFFYLGALLVLVLDSGDSTFGRLLMGFLAGLGTGWFGVGTIGVFKTLSERFRQS